MSLDLLIKNGTIIDGTGFPRYRADVGVKDGAIVAKGRINEAASRVIDAEGLAVAPGVIDLHTHYDVQLPWECLGTSSIWHGVTTVMTGNCGLTVAPVRQRDQEFTLGIFAVVEELRLDVIKAGISWQWETFGEYMDVLGRLDLGLNVLPLVGHHAIRRYVMGEAASERAAIEEEVRRMQQVLRESLQAGAWGWSAGLSPVHAGPNGEPVPGRLAEDEELLALAETQGEFRAGSIALLPRTTMFGLDESDRALMEKLSLVSGLALVWNGFFYRWNMPDAAFNQQEWMSRASWRGANIWTLLRALPLDQKFTLKRTRMFAGLQIWRDLMELPLAERVAAFSDPTRRQSLRGAIDAPLARTSERGPLRSPIRWSAVFVGKVSRPENQRYVGRSVADIAAQENKHVVDVILDIALSENLETEFRYQLTMPEDVEPTARLIQHPQVLPYQSDAGAHVNSDCLAGETSYLFGHWVRDKGIFTLEEAVKRVTFMPAVVAGLRDRGLIREGLAADIMVFDPEKIGVREKEIVADMPNGDTRIIQKAEGVRAVIVNGRVVVQDGQATGELPGRVLRCISTLPATRG